MDSLCRVCIEEATKCTLINSKIGNSSSLSFLDFLNKCTSLNACESDSLPQSLCSNCANSLQIFHSFVQLAEKSDIIFREALKTILTEGYNSGDIFCEDITIKPEPIEEEVEVLVLHTSSNADFEDAELYENNEPFFVEETGETGNENSQPKNLDLESNDSEDIPLNLLRNKLYSDKAESEPIKTIDTKKDAKTDVQTNQNPDGFCCNKCHRVFKIKTDFENHMRWVHRYRKRPKNRKGEGRYKCKHCTCTYHSKTGLWHHEGLIHNINKKKKSIVCTICDKSFYTDQGFRDHELVHTKKKNYACSLCSKEFPRQSSLRTHVRAHHTHDGNYKCVVCKKVFQDREEFRTHCRNHINDQTTLECKTCGKSFTNRKYLNKHTKIHKETEYKCTECGKDCKYSHELRIHMMVHTGERPFVCEICGKSFRLKSVYRRHTRNHCGISYIRCGEKRIIENKFECEICNKLHETEENLKLHMEIHKGIKYSELSEEIKIETTREELDSFCEATEEPVIYFYKPKHLDDSTYIDPTDGVIELSDNS